jgi:galactokinase/mevalonate kinase-like predicted kinase
VPLQNVCLRAYGIDDPFRGAIGKATTHWLGRPAPEWFKARGITLAAAGIDPDTDIQAAPVFPVLIPDQMPGDFVQWLIDAKPKTNPAFRTLWLNAERLSADELGSRADLKRLYAQRTALRQESLPALMRNQARSVFYRLDLQQTAREFAASPAKLPPQLPESEPDTLKRVHDLMFHAAVLRQRGKSGWQQVESQAFQLLRDAIVEPLAAQPVLPRLRLLEDQIAWGRSPIRLDLAGGWSDTPPYCLLNGGRVVNLAADLNGQPPLQVFLKRRETPEIVLRSIDLGVEERVSSYAQIADFTTVGGPFSIVKAALALAGFHPLFQAEWTSATLRRQLQANGGGLELSLVAAVPKGSGLGTSSILAATILGTLNDACALGWSDSQLVARTLALEQLLTTGGGWQDQAGGLLRGVKFIETLPGLQQAPVVRWLPDQPFGPLHANQTILLYYTGITRVAKNILQEIVHGMFLNSASHLAILNEIADHARHTCDVVQRADPAAIAQAVARSWELNQRLDAGTNPPAVQVILSQIQDWTAGAKLLGAGGGGYLLMFAKDATAATRIREELTRRPPNPKARFVDFSLSQTGLQITKS